VVDLDSERSCKRIESRESKTMSYAINKGVRIHYEIVGNGPPLILQHGFTQSVKDWHRAGYVEALKPTIN
jgi:hypothetical protein